MTVKTRNIKADKDLEIAVWEKAAKAQKVGGKESFNNWARHHLNLAAERILRHKGNK